MSFPKTNLIGKKSFSATVGFRILCLVSILFTFVSPALSQVAVTLGVQEVYDDNIFLENGERRPNPLVINSAIEDDISDGQLSFSGGDSNDGKEDSDFITNLYVAASGEFDSLTSFAESGWDAQVGLLLFGEYSELNRVTLDGSVDLNLSDVILPEPYYLGSTVALTSETQDISNAQGSSARSSEFLTASLRTGVRNIELASSTFFGAGYTGSYNVYLGELFLSSDDNEEFEEEGSDSHSHVLSSSIEYQVNQKLRTGIVGSGGVTLYTSVESDDPSVERDSDALDRYNGELAWTVSYVATEKLTFGASVGVNYTSFINDQMPIERSFIDDSGMSQTFIEQADDNETTLIFGGGFSYLFQPGSTLGFNVSQEKSSDIDGDLITTRSITGNLTKAFGDRLTFVAGASYLQFSTDDSLSGAIDRVEGSTSLSYLLTQNTSLVVGYSYTQQDVDDSNLEESLRFNTQDYTGNKVYIGLNTGILGLPG